jgi:hypothetical protein
MGLHRHIWGSNHNKKMVHQWCSKSVEGRKSEGMQPAEMVSHVMEGVRLRAVDVAQVYYLSAKSEGSLLCSSV